MSPNITGTGTFTPFSDSSTYGRGYSGAITRYGNGTVYKSNSDGAEHNQNYGMRLDASLSSAVYKAISKVQSPAVNALVAIRY